MKRMTIALLTLATGMLLLGDLATAQDNAAKPMVVVSVAGFDQLTTGLDWIGTATDQPGLTSMLEDRILSKLGDEGLDGLDKTKPLGIVVFAEGSNFPAHACLPVTDLPSLLKALTPLTGNEPTKAEDGSWRLTLGDQEILVKEHKGYAVLADSAATMELVGDEPLTYLGDLPKQYDVAVKVVVENIPPIYRDMVEFYLQMGLQQGLSRKPNESLEDFRLRTQIARRGIEQFTQLLKELEAIQLGLKVDPKAKEVWLEYGMWMQEGTDSAARMVAASDVKSTLAGLGWDDAVATLHSASVISPSQIAQSTQEITQSRDKLLRELRKENLNRTEMAQTEELIEELTSLVIKTVEQGQLEMGAAVRWPEAGPVLVVGGNVADPAEFDSLLRKMAKWMLGDSKSTDQIQLQLDAATHEGVKIHLLTVPLAAFPVDPDVAKLFDGELEVAIGVADAYVYLAAGKDVVGSLESALDRAATTGEQVVPPMELIVNVRNALDAVSKQAPPEAADRLEKIRELLGEEMGDRLIVRSTAEDRGVRVRFALEEGALKVVGRLLEEVELARSR